MKKLIYILTAAALVQAACTNLDERVYDQLTADDYFDNFTEEDIPAALGSVYSDLRTLYAGDNVHTEGCWLYTNEETGDGWVTPSRGGAWYDGGIYQRLNNHTWKIDDAHVLGNWRKAYAAINTCNRLMYEFGSADIKPESKEKLMAELHVARAFWYYVLCDMYGNVPLVTKYDVPKGWLPETAPRKDIFEFVVKEIKDNRGLLTEKGYGRWDYYAATMLLAKVYLNAEVWVGESYWQEVVDLCNEIIDSKKYSLDSDYKQIFVTENQNSPEIILAGCNDEIYDAALPFRIHLWTHHWNYRYHHDTETFFWGGCCATPDLANSYDPADTRFEDSWAEGPLYDNTGELTGVPGSPIMCDPKDPKDQGLPLVYTRNIPIYNPGKPESMTGEGAGVRMSKYEIKKKAKNLLSNDFVIFRYADVLFMKAEALWRQNGKTADGTIAGLINDVRRRAFADFTSAKMLQASQLDDERFLQEYAWEFCQEGHRRQQLIRFGVFTTKKWFQHEGTGEDAHLNVFPIPRDELLANDKLRQNEGYPRL